MFRILFFFSKCFLLLLFLLSPHFVFAWNNMCYSPVQMAALLSKPKKKKTSTEKIRKALRDIGNEIEDLNEELSRQKNILKKSLDGDKLETDPGNVARGILNYIDKEKDGWDCGSSGGGQSFLFQSPYFLEVFGQLLIPPAFGEAELKATEGKDYGPVSENETAEDFEKQAACINSGGTWDKSAKQCIKVDVSSLKAPPSLEKRKKTM